MCVYVWLSGPRLGRVNVGQRHRIVSQTTSDGWRGINDDDDDDERFKNGLMRCVNRHLREDLLELITRIFQCFLSITPAMAVNLGHRRYRLRFLIQKDETLKTWNLMKLKFLPPTGSTGMMDKH